MIAIYILAVVGAACICVGVGYIVGGLFVK